MSDKSSGTEPRLQRPTSGDASRSPILFLIAAAMALVVVVIVVAFVVKGGDDEADVEATADRSTSTVSTTTHDVSTSTSQSSEESNASAKLDGAATTPVSVPAPDIETSILRSVRVASQDGFDRVVFEFDGVMPGYDIGYADGPLYEEGSGKEVDVNGERVIALRITPASGVRLTSDGYEQVYTGAKQIEGPASSDADGSVVEVVEVGDFEGQLQWAVGTVGEKPFKVTALTDPTRLVVDVAQ